MPTLGRPLGGAAEAAGSLTASSLGTTVTAAGSTNTKGSWVQLIAATSFAASWAVVTLNAPNGTRRYLVDIGIGAAASEVAIIPNVPFQPASGSNAFGYSVPFLVRIPAGSRVAARAQSSSASATLQVGVTLIATAPEGPVASAGVFAYGADTADSGLVALDPGGSANAKGAWVELTPAATAPIRLLVICLGGDLTARAAAQNWLLDIGIGGSGSEVAVVPDLPVWSGSVIDTPSPAVFSYPVPIASGVRIAARCQCSVNTVTERLLDVGVYGCG